MLVAAVVENTRKVAVVDKGLAVDVAGAPIDGTYQNAVQTCFSAVQTCFSAAH
jgi:hypothetical protein